MLLYFFLLYTTYSYDIAIVGASGRLGRELVYQSTKNMNKKSNWIYFKTTLYL